MEENKEMHDERWFDSMSEDALYDTALREGWEQPEPLCGHEEALPEFPLSCLPGPVYEFARALCIETQTPAGMAGILALGVLAAAFQNRYVLEVTPGWSEPLNLYTAAVAAPGERKSSVIKAMTGPLYRYETKRRIGEKMELAIYNVRRDRLSRRIELLKGSGGGGEAQVMEELSELTEQLEELPERWPYRLLIDDATPEKLAEVMDQQGGSIVLASSEGGVFQAMQGRYDARASYDVYLKSHAGDPLYVDRIGRRSNIIINPRLTMLLTVQPEVVRGVMRSRQMVGRGLPARILYGWCPSRLGSRCSAPAQMPRRVHEDYYSLITAALEGQERAVLHTSEPFDRDRRLLQDIVEGEFNERLEGMPDWGAKLVGALLRIAALFHCARYPKDAGEHPIGSEVLNRAFQLMDYLIASAQRAYNVSDSRGRMAQFVWDKLASSGRAILTRAELYNLCKARIRYSKDLSGPLAQLEQLGYIRTEETEKPSGGRRGMKIYVNPLTHIS